MLKKKKETPTYIHTYAKSGNVDNMGQGTATASGEIIRNTRGVRRQRPKQRYF
jgi:hypothetical protein